MPVGNIYSSASIDTERWEIADGQRLLVYLVFMLVKTSSVYHGNLPSLMTCRSHKESDISCGAECVHLSFPVRDRRTRPPQGYMPHYNQKSWGDTAFYRLIVWPRCQEVISSLDIGQAYQKCMANSMSYFYLLQQMFNFLKQENSIVMNNLLIHIHLNLNVNVNVNVNVKMSVRSVPASHSITFM